MSVNEKIRVMREINQWSQEEMAEKMNMSTTGYAKIERGETKLNLHKLEQIANIFNIDILELINSEPSGNKGIFVLMNENGNHTANYYNDINLEIEKLQLQLSHKDDVIQYKDKIISQKDGEISALKEIIELLKAKN